MATEPVAEAGSAVLSKRSRRARHVLRGASSTYDWQQRIDGLVAGTRLGFTFCAFLAINPSDPVRNAPPILGIVLVYALYSMSTMALAWSSAASLSQRARFGTQVIDVGVAIVLIALSGGTHSLFSSLVVFPLLSASLRWKWRGAICAGGSLLASYGGIALYTILSRGRAEPELNSFIIAGAYLVAVTAILAYLGCHDDRIQREMGAVAAWKPSQSDEVDGPLRDLLGHVASVVDAPRVLLFWQVVDQPLMTMALWTHGQFHSTADVSATLEPPVAAPLRDRNFVCPDAAQSNARVVCMTHGQPWCWRGSPLGDGFRSAFAIHAVMAVCLDRPLLRGRLFVLDKPAATSDDLVLATVVARQVENVLEHDYLARRLRETTLALERNRVARELHDGVLQGLAAAALRLEAIRSRLAVDRTAALDGIHELQTMISHQQRELRLFVRELKTGRGASDWGLGDLLTMLAFRIEQEWQLAVKLDLKLQPERFEASISPELAREIHHTVREALVNTARHTLASLACVSVRLEGGWVRITVADNGQGFPFRGRFEDTELVERGLGPVMLRQRVAALGGRLVIETGDDGARLEIDLPQHGTVRGVDPASPRPRPASVSAMSGPLSPGSQEPRKEDSHHIRGHRSTR
jgi:signal transduction histidine kinase